MSELVDGAGAVAEINYAHDAMINMVLANRGVHQNQIAEELGYSPAWVSVVMSTPIFQEKLARRAAQLEDPILKEKIRVLMQTTMHRSLEVLSKKMEADALEIPDNLALRSFEVTSRALGYGARVEALLRTRDEAYARVFCLNPSSNASSSAAASSACFLTCLLTFSFFNSSSFSLAFFAASTCCFCFSCNASIACNECNEKTHDTATT